MLVSSGSLCLPGTTKVRPTKVQIESERGPVVADKPLELVCRAFGSRPAALISWWRGHTRLLPAPDTPPSESEPHGLHHRPASRPANAAVQIHESVSADSNVTSSTLLFVPQIEDEGQLISCRAENAYISALGLEDSGEHDKTNNQAGSGSIEDSLRLEVHYLPRVQLRLGDNLHEGEIREGQAVYFDCLARAQPAAHEIRWWFEGRELDMNRTAGVIISNQSLALARVSRHQRGRYTCSAANSVGEAHSSPLLLRVQYAPVCRDQAPELEQRSSSTKVKLLYGAARLEPVQVRCQVDAEPADNSLQYRWAFAGPSWPAASGAEPPVQLDAGQHRSLAPNEPLASLATYTPRSDLDYGWLLCWAKNSVGQQVEPCAYRVVPAERPDPVSNCQLVNVTESQLGVACEPGYDGGIEQSFQMEVYAADHEHELVANVTGAAAYQGAQPAELAMEDEEQQQDDQAPEAPRSGGQDAAVALKQQKQRHSSHTGRQAKAQEAAGAHPAALLITEPSLRPSTDYLLSIYSRNSKGASKPVAFMATTSAASAIDALAVSPSVRDTRKSGKCLLFISRPAARLYQAGLSRPAG